MKVNSWFKYPRGRGFKYFVVAGSSTLVVAGSNTLGSRLLVLSCSVLSPALTLGSTWASNCTRRSSMPSHSAQSRPRIRVISPAAWKKRTWNT